MSYLVTLSFDIHNEPSETYERLDLALAAIGLNAKLTGSSGKTHDLPANTYVGEYEGENVSKVRDDITTRVEAAFERVGVKSQIFLTVGGNWAWSVRYT